MEKSWFRLSVCLKNFFSDERARCYVSVEGRRPVRWLRQRLLCLFGAPLRERAGARFGLTCRGHLLPDDEPLALMSQDDLIVAVPVLFDIPGEGDDFEDCVCSRHDVLKSKFGNTESLNTNYRLETNHTSKNSPNYNEVLPKEVHSGSSRERDYDNTVLNERTRAMTPNEEFETNDLRLKLSQELQDYKQRALDMLDKCNLGEDDSIPYPKRKRRRVRRRRQPQDLDRGSARAERYHYDSSQSVGNPEEEKYSLRGVSDEPVCRNTSLEVRAARLMHPLTVDPGGW